MSTPVRVDKQEIAERLKERIYVTFTALAVVLALLSHGEPSWQEALSTLAIAVVGTLLAVFIADVLARTTVNERLLSREEFGHVVSVVLGALGAIVLPVLLLVLAALDVWSVDNALLASAFSLVLALVVFGFIAVRKTRLPWWQRALVLLAEALLGLLVIALELLAHG